MVPVRFRAVLFDMDNTLHDLTTARTCAIDAVMEWCNDTGGDLQYYFLNTDTPSLVEDSLRQYLQDRRMYSDEAFRACSWVYHAVEMHSLEPVPGIEQLLRDLKSAGIRLAVISNASKDQTIYRLKELGLTGYFDLVVTPETFGVKKPHPDVYLKTLACLGVTPAEAVMIGDKINRDVVPPRELGIYGIHAAYGSREKAYPVAVNTPAEIPDLLRHPV